MRSMVAKCADAKRHASRGLQDYCTMLHQALAGRFAPPAVDVTSPATVNAALRGLAESEADGIIPISTALQKELLSRKRLLAKALAY
jgi:fructose/tagatose bisphosphate aldolase